MFSVQAGRGRPLPFGRSVTPVKLIFFSSVQHVVLLSIQQLVLSRPAAADTHDDCLRSRVGQHWCVDACPMNKSKTKEPSLWVIGLSIGKVMRSEKNDW